MKSLMLRDAVAQQARSQRFDLEQRQIRSEPDLETDGGRLHPCRRRRLLGKAVGIWRQL